MQVASAPLLKGFSHLWQGPHSRADLNQPEHAWRYVPNAGSPAQACNTLPQVRVGLAAKVSKLSVPVSARIEPSERKPVGPLEAALRFVAKTQDEPGLVFPVLIPNPTRAPLLGPLI